MRNPTFIDETASSKAQKAENKIDYYCQKYGVSKNGCQWIKCALDPFSDIPETCDGFPDLVTTPSVVQLIPRTLTQTVPTVVPAGQNWDMFIVLNPLINTHLVAGIAANAQGNFDANTAYAPLAGKGGLEVYAGISGVQMGITQLRAILPIPDQYLIGTGRVLGMAFEVHDVSQNLIKQGSVITFRQAARNSQGKDSLWSLYDSTLAARKGAVLAYNEFGPYQTPAQALLQPFARQWKAEDGCYCVATMNNNNNDPTERENVGSVTRDNTAIGGFTMSLLQQDATNIISLAGSGQVIPSPYNMSCAYFTGLPYAGSYQVNVRYIYEVFPTAAENPTIAVLARPSPTFDPKAWEVYAKVAQKLPSAVMVKDNAAADWISSIADAIGTVIPGVAKIGNFIAPTAGKWIDDFLWGKTPAKEEEKVEEVKRLTLPPPVRNSVQTQKSQNRPKNKNNRKNRGSNQSTKNQTNKK
jgi:hypothetical protein